MTRIRRSPPGIAGHIVSITPVGLRHHQADCRRLPGKPEAPARRRTRRSSRRASPAAAQTLTKMAALQDRLYRVAAPLLINNAALCKSHARNLLGFTAKNRYSYPGEYNEAAHLAFGMGDRLQVTGVLAGSGAAQGRACRRGDRLVSAGGKPLPTGANAPTLAGAVFGPLVRSQATLPFVIERDGNSSATCRFRSRAPAASASSWATRTTSIRMPTAAASWSRAA